MDRALTVEACGDGGDLDPSPKTRCLFTCKKRRIAFQILSIWIAAIEKEKMGIF